MRIIDGAKLTAHGNRRGRELVVDILDAGLDATDPAPKVRQLVRLEGERLVVGDPLFEPPGSPRTGNTVYDLARIGRIYVFGAGKGVQHMARPLEEILGDRLTGGHVIDKHGAPVILERIGVTFGAHPVPDEGCVQGCLRILEMAQGLMANDLVFTLACSGISSLLTLPAPGVTLDDIRQMTYLMQIERGAPTSDLNPIRSHLDRMKGGRISRYIQPARAVHLFGSTLPYTYDDLMHRNSFLHNHPEGTTYADAVASLQKWQAWDAVAPSIRAWLTKADPRHETVKVDEFERTDFRTFRLTPEALSPLAAARRRSLGLGLTPHMLATHLIAEAREAGFVVGTMAAEVERNGEPFAPPCALLSGGELLVTVGEETGVGGRNQEFALAAALRIAGSANVVVGAVDTDGTDGPGTQYHDVDLGGVPCLAGGVTDGYTLGRARELGLDLHDILRRHDASPALVRLESGVVAEQNIGLCDLRVAVILGRS